MKGAVYRMTTVQHIHVSQMYNLLCNNIFKIRRRIFFRICSDCHFFFSTELYNLNVKRKVMHTFSLQKELGQENGACLSKRNGKELCSSICQHFNLYEKDIIMYVKTG